MRSRLTYVLTGVVLGLGILLGFSHCRAERFERRAAAAELFATERRDANKILVAQNDALLRRIMTRGTVISRDRKAVEAVDARNPPPDTCTPNLVARDALIESQGAQVLDLTSALAIARAMHENERVAVDSLRAALKSRPGALLDLGFVSIGQPKLGVFAGICFGGSACAGGGIVIPIRIG